jgi:hypothetical protein
MSVSTEVQRTLVKSPPELWSELSNPDALARHLSELGEIRITAVEPETKVEWETEGSSGVVQLKQSGWGTKVTLSVTRTAPALEESPSEHAAVADPAAAEPEAIADPTATEPEPVAVELEPEPAAVELEPEPAAVELEPEPNTTSEPTGAEAEDDIQPERAPLSAPDPQLGFFARLFRRRRTRSEVAIDATPEPEVIAEPEPSPEIEVVALAAPEPIYPEPPVEEKPEILEPAGNLATELASMEAQMTVETTELLTGVLDRLGAAHHRPFSRG